jgi:HAD superfamily hydrolase (TIGR01490 family)
VALALFDLDHTLLAGDSDELWCDYLIAQGALDGEAFAARNHAVAIAYRAGTVGTHEFCAFYVSTLAGRTPAQWEPLRRAFLEQVIVTRIPVSAIALLDRHRAAGDELVLTTATNRFITELTARHLGIATVLATECGFDAAGRFSGELDGAPNMREGKVARLEAWLADRGRRLQTEDSVFYTDSINDLPLLERVRRPVAVDPEPRLATECERRGWPTISLHAR